MGYDSIDEVIRREACEKVKQIVKAIKAIKIKYYLNFSKISAKDQEMYEKLETRLEEISNSHNLKNLKVALMEEVEAKYDGRDIENMGMGMGTQPDDLLQACYGAIDAQKEALSKGRITQALRCQEQLKKYRQELNSEQEKEISNYKREKFAELMQSRDQVEEQIKSWGNRMKGMYKIKHVEKRKNTMEMIENKVVQQTRSMQEESLEI